ncbi:MAG: MFS transporter [Rhodospirillales bacterium]|nr:MFS transporter [Rhodospirillales bacterium]
MATVSVPATEVTERQRRYTLFLLLLIFTFSNIDRHILAVLLEPIKHELKLSDTQLGFLSGLAFAVFYSTLGIPMAMWADRRGRKNVILLALAVWSAMTVLCGMATNFVHLALARMGVSIGEAGSSPPSNSMIADLYPPNRRATAMSIYALGINIGILAGFMIGGWINQLYGWRVAFYVVGAPGLILAAIGWFTLREPPRGHADGWSGATVIAPPLGAIFRHVWKTKSIRHIIAGASLSSFVGYGGVAWTASYLIRNHGMTTGEAGSIIGLYVGFAGGLGVYVGGVLADRLGHYDQRWGLWLIAVSGLISAPFYAGFLLTDSTVFALALWAIPVFVSVFYVGSTGAWVQGLTPLGMRSVVPAVNLLIINVIGLGLGPMTVGVLSDLLEPSYGIDSLRRALLIVGSAWLWGGLHFYLASRTLREDLAGMDKST